MEGGREGGMEEGKRKRKKREEQKEARDKIHPADKGLTALGSAPSKQVYLLKSMPPRRSQ